MTHAEINLGYGCNSLCCFCMTGNAYAREKKFASQKRINKELALLYNKRFRSVGILGGEPTMHPDILSIVSFAKRIGYTEIAIITNGMLLSKKGFLKQLVSAGVNRFSVSIHSHQAANEDAMMNKKGGFRKKITAIKNLVALRNQGDISNGVAINSVIYEDNYREMISFAKYFKNIGVQDIRFNFVRAEGRSKSKKQIVPSLKQVFPYAEKLVAWNERYGKLHITFGDIPWCFFHGMYEKDENMFFRYIGDTRDLATDVSLLSTLDTKKFNWQKRKGEKMKKKFLQCSQCVFYASCGGVYKNYCKIYPHVGVLKPFIGNNKQFVVGRQKNKKGYNT